MDSPTYDGDIESSATAGPGNYSSARLSHHHHASSTSTFGAPISPVLPSSATATPNAEAVNPIPSIRPSKKDSGHSHPVFISAPTPLAVPEEPPVPAASKAAFDPAALTQEDIQAFVQKAISGETWRKYKINTPPVDRPIRVYADGRSITAIPTEYLPIRLQEFTISSISGKPRTSTKGLFLDQGVI